MAGNKRFTAFMFIALVSLFFVGCSDDSDPVAVAPASTIDTAPPAPPANLIGTLLAGSRIVDLSWDANTVDSDLAGYMVTRVNGTMVTDLMDEPITINEFADANPMPGVNVYSVYAVDDSGNESAITSVSVELAAPRLVDDMAVQ